MSSGQSGMPLRGVRVLEFGHIVAGPTAGLVFALLGADVVKIEPPSGEQARGMRDLGAGVFPTLNRAKRSLAVDLKDPADREKLDVLVRDADIVLSNYSRSASERLRIDYDSLQRLNDDLIYGEIAGFRAQSAYAARPALDEVVQMMCGLAYMTGPEGRPLRAGASIVDMGAALFLVIGALAALRQREETGAGGHIESTLYGTGLFYMGTQMATRQITGAPSLPFPEHGVGRRYGWPVYDLFETVEGERVFVAATSDRHWRALADMIGEESFLTDPRLGDHDGRVENRDHVLSVVGAWIGERTYVELATALEDAGLPYAPVRSPDGVLDDDGSADDLETVTADGVAVRVPRLPIGAGWASARRPITVPELGDVDHWLDMGGDS